MRVPGFFKRLALPSLAGLLVVGIYMHGEQVVAVRVELLEGAQEEQDETLMGIGAGGKAPDYLLQLVTRSGTIDCGYRENSPVGEQGLTFPLEAPLLPSLVEQVVLIEKDRLVDDDVEHLDVAGTVTEGERYRFVLVLEHSFWAGVDAFFSTGVGVLLLFVFGAALTVTLAGRMFAEEESGPSSGGR